ncbi:MAG: L,D-transpeptidase family protein [Pseudomonadota bacterium]
MGVALPLVPASVAASGDAVAMVTAPTRSLISPAGSNLPEDLLLEVIDKFRAGQTHQALYLVDSLIKEQPTYRLAHLLRGDILSAQAGLPTVVDASAKDTNFNHLLAEARQRWQGHAFAPGDRLPAPLLKTGTTHPTIVVVDLSLSRLFLFDNRGPRPRLIDDYYVSSGKNGFGKERKGDKKTPLGVYFVTQRLPGEALPDRYGPVAFPVDYPNDWDRRLGRTGSGIWVHGVASANYSRPPADSDGCVALVNSELSVIAPLIKPGVTPVLIGHDIAWLTPAESDAQATNMSQALERWRRDWESGDTDEYLSHYAYDFVGRGMDKAAWSAYKRRVALGKQFVRVALNDVSVYGHPNEKGLVVVTFEQRYRSNNFNATSRKRQYWRVNETGRWQIVSESAAGAG